MSSVTATHPSGDQWTRVRQLLNQRRHELAQLASALYPEQARVRNTRLLTLPAWTPTAPVPLGTVQLEWLGELPAPVVDGTGDVTAHVRSLDGSGNLLPTYADTLGALARPSVFENRPAYRLHAADLGSSSGKLTFGRGSYFDGVNVGEAAAHELAATSEQTQQPSQTDLPLRTAVGDPCDLTRRPAIPAVTTLSIRLDRAQGEATFILHWRDPANVAHGGGLYQVMPVGIFQPVDTSDASLTNDFDLWRCMSREYSEEFLGSDEDYELRNGALDYDSWHFYQAITSARDEGKARPFVLGLGVDPLTWATDLLTAVVFDSDCFDSLFHNLVRRNTEGLVMSDAGIVGTRFEPDSLRPLIDGTEPMQAAGAAALSLASDFRDQLLA